jgi:hypothetical protein
VSGWYPNNYNKKLYEVLDKEFQISKMCPGEYMEVNINWDDKWISVLYGLLIVEKNTRI